MNNHKCPVWIGYLLISPLRKILQNPVKILSPYIEEGMTVLEPGCAMGYFSLPLARLVGPDGKVICVDIQQKMLDKLKTRLNKAKLTERTELRLAAERSLNVEDYAQKVDFAIAFAVVHESCDVASFFSDIAATLKPGGKLLIAEPKGHVTEEMYKETLKLASDPGLKLIERPEISRSRAALFLNQSLNENT